MINNGEKIYITSNHVCVLEIIFIIIIKIIKYIGLITFNNNIFRYTSKIECSIGPFKCKTNMRDFDASD